jgi:hypothetical protein
MASKVSNSTVVTKLNLRLKGLLTYGAQLGPIHSNGKTLTVAEVAASYQKSLDDRVQVNTARGAYHSLVVQQKQDDAVWRAIDKDLKPIVEATFGRDSQAVADFGYAGPQPHKASVKAKAAGLLKSEATRAARKTMGKRQKATVKGEPAAQPAAAPEPPVAPVAPVAKS